MISVSCLLHPVCISEGWHLCHLLLNILIIWSLVVFNRGINLQNSWEPGKAEGWVYSLLAICPIIRSGLIFIFFLKKGLFLLGDFVLPCSELEKLLSPYPLICGLLVTLWPCGNSVLCLIWNHKDCFNLYDTDHDNPSPTLPFIKQS